MGVVVFHVRIPEPVSSNREASRVVGHLSLPDQSSWDLVKTATWRFTDGREIALDEVLLARVLRTAGTVRPAVCWRNKMRIQDWVGVVSIVGIVAAGAVVVGRLQAEVNQLRAQSSVAAIEAARDAALESVREGVENAVLEMLAERSAAANADTTTTYAKWHQTTDNSTKSLLRISDGICFLVTVSGRFEGGGEALSVWENDGRWVFGGRSGPGGGGIQGEARCWRFPWAESN